MELLRQVPDLDKDGSRRCPTEEYRSPGRKARKLPEKRAKAVRHESLHQVLILIVDEPVKEKRIALREDRRRHLGRALGGEDEPQAELPAFARDALEHPRALACSRRRGLAAQFPVNEGMCLFQNQGRGKLLTVLPSIPLKRLEDHPCKHADDDVDDFRGDEREVDNSDLPVCRLIGRPRSP